MKIFEVKEKLLPNLAGLEKSSFYKFLTIAKKTDSSIVKQVEKIIAATKKDGDKALISYSNKFDKAQFSKAKDLLASKKEIDAALKNIAPTTLAALKMAYERITAYHKKQLPQDFLYTDEQGVTLGNSWRAIESIGVYAPGGTASYPSSVLMSAVPAIVAGAREIRLCVPSESGKLNDAVLVAAHICGISEIYKIGGAQAIAALAYGTKSNCWSRKFLCGNGEKSFIWRGRN